MCVLCSFQYASTHHGAQQGEAARRSSDMRQARHLPPEVVLGILVQPIDGSGLTPLPPVYGEAWARARNPGTPDSTFPRYGRHPRQTCGSDSKTSLNNT
ncbi:hypothetical protein TNCV_1633201 [Trichonephila clavipes]|nr:hypothetical protein TNCV_1633201 [Trichonephila clavipes]